MKIHTNLLAVQFKCRGSLYGSFLSELWIFDLKAGKKLAVGTIGPADDPLLIHYSAGRANNIVHSNFCQIE